MCDGDFDPPGWRQSGLGGRRQIVDGGRGESCGALGTMPTKGGGDYGLYW